MTPADGAAVAKTVLNDLVANPVGFVGAGVAYVVVTLIVVVLAIATLGLSLAPGAYLQDDTVMVVGGLVGSIPYTLLIVGFSFVGFPVLNANLIVALDGQRGGMPIGFSSVLGGAERRGPVIAFYLIGQALTLVGALLCYFPAFVMFALTLFAFPIVVLEDVSAVDALRIGWDHLRRNPLWHAVVWVLMFALLVAAELTMVGVLVLFPLMAAWQYAAYRAAFGEAGAVSWSEAQRRGSPA